MEKDRLHQFIKQHYERLNPQILLTSFIFLSLSVLWNSIFFLFDIPYSRANLPILVGCLFLCILLMGIRKYTPTVVMPHFTISFILIVFVGLYFGSGFTQAWTYFLITPIITGLYGNKLFLIGYSFISFIQLSILSVYFPLQPIIDVIDISNRLLCYIIVTTFSYLVIVKLQNLYEKQIEMIEHTSVSQIEQIVKTFVISVEAKDIYTFGHSERVSKYAVELAKLLPEFKDSKKLHDIHLMGLLHDIGKINIPECILCKPSSLTEEEFEYIKTHPVVGTRMIEKVEGLERLKSGVLYHHERWDGKGYPTQTKGLDIPLEARVLAIADAFDAMTSSRAYRQAMDPSEAFKRIIAGKGTQFDPNIVEKAEQIKFKWFEICKSHKDDFDEFEQAMDLF